MQILTSLWFQGGVSHFALVPKWARPTSLWVQSADPHLALRPKVQLQAHRSAPLRPRSRGVIVRFVCAWSFTLEAPHTGRLQVAGCGLGRGNESEEWGGRANPLETVIVCRFRVFVLCVCVFCGLGTHGGSKNKRERERESEGERE